MTEREAIKELKKLCPETCAEYRNEFCNKLKSCEIRDCIDMAIAALELQTPKKPKYILVCDEPEKYSPECPFCHEEVEEDASHCDNCLQMLDWSVDND